MALDPTFQKTTFNVKFSSSGSAYIVLRRKNDRTETSPSPSIIDCSTRDGVCLTHYDEKSTQFVQYSSFIVPSIPRPYHNSITRQLQTRALQINWIGTEANEQKIKARRACGVVLCSPHTPYPRQSKNGTRRLAGCPPAIFSQTASNMEGMRRR